MTDLAPLPERFDRTSTRLRQSSKMADRRTRVADLPRSLQRRVDETVTAAS